MALLTAELSALRVEGGPVGEGLVGEGLVGEGLVGEGLVGEGLVREGPVGTGPVGSRGHGERWDGDGDGDGEADGGGETATSPPTHTRVPPERRPASDRLAPDAPAPPGLARDRPGAAEGSDGLADIPWPGRHAHRRLALPVLDRLVPESLRGRVALGSPQVAVVAVLVAMGLAITCWYVLRAAPDEIAVPTDLGSPGADTGAALATPAPADAPPGEPSGSSATEPGVPGGSSSLVVDVSGRVRRPGIVVLGPGARVVDALRAAGGARPGVSLASLNLARPVVDGEQILVGIHGPPGVAAQPVPASSAPVAGALVDLNTADQATLETRPEVGPITAQAILAWRTEHGSFTAVEELLEVDGIGEATLAQIAPHVTI